MMGNLAGFHLKLGCLDDAESLLTEVVESQRRTLGDHHPDTLISKHNLARVYLRLGRFDRAEGLFTQTLNAQRAILGNDHPHTLVSRSSLGELYHRTGAYEQAEAALGGAISGARRALSGQHPNTAVSLRRYGRWLSDVERLADGEPLLIEAHEIFTAVLGPMHDESVKMAEALVQLYEAWNEPDKVSRWRVDLKTLRLTEHGSRAGTRRGDRRASGG